MRRVYGGPLTYAANWADDFEVMPFWDDLDLLGLNMYYPLANLGELPRADSPRVRELRNRLAAISRRYRKPILFTEVGYAATEHAAAEPWEEDNAPLDPAMQARCYEVIFQAFSRERGSPASSGGNGPATAAGAPPTTPSARWASRLSRSWSAGMGSRGVEGPAPSWENIFGAHIMAILSIEIPEGVLSALHRSVDEAERDARLAIAIEWYRRGAISQGRAAEIAGLARADFIDDSPPGRSTSSRLISRS